MEQVRIPKGDKAEDFYWLGFFASDGCVAKDRGCERQFGMLLSIKDVGHLKKFCSWLGSGKPPIIDLKRGSCQVRFCNSSFCDWLRNYGVVHGKTQIDEAYLERIPQEFKWAFVCGYFDGDGTAGVYSSRKKNKEYCQAQVSILGLPGFLENVRDFLFRNGIICARKLVRDGEVIHRLSIYSLQSVKSFAKEYIQLGEVTLGRKRDVMNRIYGGSLCH